MDALDNLALKLRQRIVRTCYLGRAGHIPPSFSSLDILISLYFNNILRYSSDKKDNLDRDYFILSKGHACLAYYNVLCEAGFFSWEDLKTFCKPGTKYGAHPTIDVNGVEFSTGALGHGLSNGVGMALSKKMKQQDNLVYVVTGDGECQEGSIWEAAMSIIQFKLNNLVWIIDNNNWQATGRISEIMCSAPFEEKLKAFGFEVISINGHDFRELKKALSVDRNHLPENPRVVIAHTQKGKGVPLIEEKREWHSKIPNEKEFEVIVEQLGMTMKEFEAL